MPAPLFRHQKMIFRADIQAAPDVLFVFGDNLAREGYGGQAKEMRGEPNSVGIPTKRAPSWDESAFYTDGDYDRAVAAMTLDIARLRRHLESGKEVVWPEDGIGTNKAQLEKRAPRIWAYVQNVKRDLEALAMQVEARMTNQAVPVAPSVAITSLEVLNKRNLPKGALPDDLVDISRYGTLRFENDVKPTLGNPYVMDEYGGRDGDRTDVVRKYALKLERDFARPGFKGWFAAALKGKRGVVCFCSKELCHGNVTKEALAAIEEGRDPIAAIKPFQTDPMAALAAQEANGVGAAARLSGGAPAVGNKVVYYAGVGSRETPPDVLKKMEDVAVILAKRGYILRSGGAVGADLAFEYGADKAQGKKEIFIAWGGLSNERREKRIPGAEKDIVGYDARDEGIARKAMAALNKNLDGYTKGAKALQCRNVRQVLGKEGTPRSSVVVAWTEGGAFKGGTATALMIAQQNGVPSINLGADQWRNKSAEEIAAEVVRLSEMSPAQMAQESAQKSAAGRDVLSFSGPNRVFSNMFAAPVQWGDAVTPARLWDCNEVPYILAKTLDGKTRERLTEVYEKAKGEARGRGLAHAEAVEAGAKKLKTEAKGLENGLFGRPEWHNVVKFEVMESLIDDKFSRNTICAKAALETGKGLIQEGNTWGDTVFGIALVDNPARGIKAGEGENRLGKMIMAKRDSLVAEGGLEALKGRPAPSTAPSADRPAAQSPAPTARPAAPAPAPATRSFGAFGRKSGEAR